MIAIFNRIKIIIMKKIIIGIVAVAALTIGICSICCPPDCCDGKTSCSVDKAKTQEASVYKMK